MLLKNSTQNWKAKTEAWDHTRVARVLAPCAAEGSGGDRTRKSTLPDEISTHSRSLASRQTDSFPIHTNDNRQTVRLLMDTGG